MICASITLLMGH